MNPLKYTQGFFIFFCNFKILSTYLPMKLMEGVTDDVGSCKLYLNNMEV